MTVSTGREMGSLDTNVGLDEERWQKGAECRFGWV
jgi:hypothetical protein